MLWIVELELRLFEVIEEMLFVDTPVAFDMRYEKAPELDDGIVEMLEFGDAPESDETGKLIVILVLHAVIEEVGTVFSERGHENVVDFAAVIESQEIPDIENGLFALLFALFKIEVLIELFDIARVFVVPLFEILRDQNADTVVAGFCGHIAASARFCGFSGRQVLTECVDEALRSLDFCRADLSLAGGTLQIAVRKGVEPGMVAVNASCDHGRLQIRLVPNPKRLSVILI